ncbi:ATP-binding protein [Paenibacillus sp. GCM10012307]|uniref:histidine kinase n=1 Tax=Paenibacillus roseus TaxID=2798579 RepID=A0A934JA07_9BACL|nr:sensor histidine kinase [Paenibacillus roseus]MBJ6363050.1 ATP-binding protein [Paenibacillus roseus]
MRDLLLDFLSILFPVMLYQFLVLAKSTRVKDSVYKISLGLLAGLAIVCSMLLPDPIINDLDGDLRNIPLIIALLYGGYLSGGISLFCFLLTRYLIGTDGWEVAFVGILTVLVATAIFHSRFARRTPRQRLVITTGLALTGFIVNGFVAIAQQHPDFLNMSRLAITGVIEMSAMVMATCLMEVTIKSKLMQRQLLSAEKMNLASHLASSVAQEVRSPLAVVKGYLQLVFESVEGKNRIYIETSLAELKRAEYVIHDFLNFAKPQLEKMEIVQVADMLHHIRQTMSETVAMHNVDLQIEAEETLLLEADRYKIMKALGHVIKNAIEASNGGQVFINAQRVLDKIQISISDNGEGMTPEELTRLGTPFYSTKTNGTGLGLMVAFRIIQAIGGQLEYTSEKGKGTTSVVSLDAAPSVAS